MYIHTDIYITTHIQTRTYTYVKLFVTCFEIPHTQIPHHIATKHPRSSTLSYRVGLDPFASSYLVVCIERTHNIPG